jgi:hypothetical protein
MALIPKNPFPNVPKLPGVPQLSRSIRFPAGPPPALGLPLALGRLWQSLFVPPQWGIYDSSNKIVVKPDSFKDMGYRKEANVPSFPVQDGSFANYNKVQQPQEYILRMNKGGSQTERMAFVQVCERLVDTLELYSILTPERRYENVNIKCFEFIRRGAEGAYFLEVDVRFTEIRQVQAQYTTYGNTTENAQDPAARSTENQGRVQPVVTTAPAFDPQDAVTVHPQP